MSFDEPLPAVDAPDPSLPGEIFSFVIGTVSTDTERESAAWDPTGRWVALGTTAGVYVYDRNDFAVDPIFIDTGLDQVNLMAFDPGGTRLAVAGTSTIRIWDPATGAYVAGWGQPAISVAWLGSDQLFFAGSDRIGSLVASSGEVDWVEPAALDDVDATKLVAVDSVAGIAVVRSMNETIRAYDARTGALLGESEAAEGSVQAVAVRGTLVAATYQGYLSVWDLPDMATLGRYEMSGFFARLDIRDDRIWASTLDGVVSWPIDALRAGEQPVYLQDDRMRPIGGLEGDVVLVDFNAAPALVSADSAQIIVQWELDDVPEIMVINPNGMHALVVGWEGVMLLDLNDPQPGPVNDTGPLVPWEVGDIDITADGRYLAVGPGRPIGYLRLHDLVGGTMEAITELQPRNREWAVWFEENRLLATDQQQWFSQADERLRADPEGRARSAGLTDDVGLVPGRAAIPRGNCTIIYDTTTREPGGAAATPDHATRAALTPDGALMVVEQISSDQLEGYEVAGLPPMGETCARHAPTWTYTTDGGSIVAITPDGRVLVSDGDRLVTLNATDGRQEAVVDLMDAGRAVLHPAGRLLLVRGKQTITIHELSTGAQVGVLPFTGSMTFDPTGSLLVIADRGEFHLLDFSVLAS